ncbi:MAG: RNA polymerase sigma factor, partial [Aquificota bacterium]
MREEELIARIARGDQQALKTLILMYNSRLFSYAYGILQNYEDAEEAVAETFYQIWRSARNFRGDSRVSTWLFGICRNVIRNMLRKNRRHPFMLEIREEDAVVEEEIEPMEVELIAKALDRLPAIHREVLHLAYYEDMPYEEIARVLGVPVNTVKTRVFNAKKKLLKAMEELKNEH